ncbi:cyclase family protein [Rhodococcus jostii]|uniref:Cyclase family protein n=1 Tax=Rhodococcus jostii TaxID=132919 RepID=A0ABU4C973_RHOJO|nr:cyclase family protein [Rhodococcus jostii]MDV6280093.1 cyclase family protein [Rhodococcus jostii]
MTNPTAPLELSITEIGSRVRGLRVHDVTPTLGPDTAMFFLNTAPQVTPLSRHATEGAAANTWEIHEHSGAHVDAPFHFDPEGQTIDELPVDVLFFRPYKKYDLSEFDLAPGAPATLEQITHVGHRDHLTLDEGDIALVDFGYDKYLPGMPDERDPSWWGRNQPGLSEDACEYFAEAKVIAVGSDTSACDLALADGQMSAGTGHGQHFLPNGILIIEGLRGLNAAPATGLFAALPLKLAGGTGSPLRVVLLEP